MGGGRAENCWFHAHLIVWIGLVVSLQGKIDVFYITRNSGECLITTGQDLLKKIVISNNFQMCQHLNTLKI